MAKSGKIVTWVNTFQSPRKIENVTTLERNPIF